MQIKNIYTQVNSNPHHKKMCQKIYIYAEVISNKHFYQETLLWVLGLVRPSNIIVSDPSPLMKNEFEVVGSTLLKLPVILGLNCSVFQYCYCFFFLLFFFILSIL